MNEIMAVIFLFQAAMKHLNQHCIYVFLKEIFSLANKFLCRH